MKFVPLAPDTLVLRLARWIDRQGPGRLRIGFDGPPEVGTTDLADRVAAALGTLNRPAVRVSTRFWWRAASLRLEYGKQDVQSRLTGWVDVPSLAREVFEPLADNGSGRYLTELRDPSRDRAIRQAYQQAPADAVLLVDGPLLLTHDLPWDRVVRIGTSAGALERALPEAAHWELEAHQQYRRQWQQPAPVDVVLSYDHPSSPAVSGLDLR